MLPQRDRRIRLWTVLAALALLVSAGLTANGASARVPTNDAQATHSANSSDQSTQKDSGKTTPFQCSRIKELGIDKQMNFHAAEILAACLGLPGPGKEQATKSPGGPVNKALSPLLGGTDADVVAPPDGTYPQVTQSESFVWGNGSVIVVNYNDSRAAPGCYAGISYSTNNGATFTRAGGGGSSPICSGHGTNFGDPIVVFNQNLNTWFAGDLATGCGGQGMGLWTSPDGINWSVGACAHNGTNDDRESMWVDNTPSSPFYGRMYISWNDFAAGQNIFVTFSDNGTSWSVPVALTVGFVRDVQMTGGPDGTAFVAGMNEGGGGFGSRTNIMYRSTNGGVSWSTITMGAPFTPPGDALCTSNSYFVNVNPIWRHMGWGQPGVGPGGVVHYAYAGHGAASGDTGDIFYTRSTDNGSTWSAPIVLNTDGTTRTQWMPSLAVTAGGAVEVSWYDRRDTANNDYEWFGRVSLDNGVSWQADSAVSDVIITQPLQPDPNIQACYAGDYNYHSAFNTDAYLTWTDGRNLISGNPQQDVYFDKVSLVQGTPTPTVTGTPPTATPTRTPTNTFTPTPTPCGPQGNYIINQTTGSIVPGTTDIGNHCDDCTTTIALPFTYNLYGQPFTSVNVSSNGNLQFVSNNAAFSNVCLPTATFNMAVLPFWDDLYTADTANGQGIFTSVSGSAPNRVFNIEWRTTLCCSVGTPTHNFEARLYEGQGRFDFVYGQVATGGTGATVGVQRDTGSLFTQYECNTGGLSASLQLNFTQPPCGSPIPTNTPTNTPVPTNTPTRTNTPTPTPGAPDFTLAVTPTSRSVVRPGSTTYIVTLTSVNGYSGSVTLSVSGLPSKTSRSFSPNPVTLTSGGTATSTLTITTQRGGPVGTFTLTITGSDGVRSHSQNVTLTLSR